ncbi:hypothetical protein [Silvimonas sp.]|uniref:hypothetical protein n=1 Tax=Silvimonas sp. TaxID=2650811 RepID=UPI0028433984|nr:hypothetical protein [Silvimonas sp.]MDR3426098.1 hypothetical protein [Silvimonas sp.]
MDLTDRRLGRKAIKTDSRTLRLERYFTAALPAPPPARDWSKGITAWGMLMNDTLGDCTIAGVGHAVQALSANAGTEATISDAVVLKYYEQWDGYNPADPSTDQGGICLDVLNNWRKNGFSGHGLIAYATALPANRVHVQQAIELFGGLYIGVSLPISAQSQNEWNVVSDDGTGSNVAGSWGGHCVFVLAYDADGLTCVTWGSLMRMTWAFWNAYVDEAYALVSHDWFSNKWTAPNGFNLAQLRADLTQIN